MKMDDAVKGAAVVAYADMTVVSMAFPYKS
jgi:hypothetical protein